MKRNPLLIFTICLLSLVIIGCATRAERLKEQGYSDSYIKGDADGCFSGTSSTRGLSASIKKDTSLFKTNKNYNQAWSEAFNSCKQEEETDANRKLLEKNKQEQNRIRNTDIGRIPGSTNK